MGYFTDIYGKCIKINLPKCLELKSSGECSYCADSLFVLDGKCDGKKIEKCTTSHCKYCKRDEKTSLEKCVFCDDDYVLLITEGKVYCKLEDQSVANCLYLNSEDEKKCSICDIGYYFDNF